MVKIEILLNALVYIACLLGVAPLYLWLDAPTKVAFPAAWLAGILLDRSHHYPLTGRPATLLAIVLFAVYALQINLANMVEPVVNLLTLLLALRLVTEKTARHYLQIVGLAVFALASSTLLTLSASYFAFLVLQVFVVTISLVLLSFFQTEGEMRLSRPQLRSLLGTALLLPVVSLILMLFFFVILPRTQHPLWTFLNPQPTGIAGFTDQVAPGSLASTAAVKLVAFRADSVELPPEQLYWRGIVLNTIEANVWKRAELPAGEDGRIVGGRQIRQTIYPRPKNDPYLIALDPPRSIWGVRVGGSADKTFRAWRKLDRQIKYETISMAGGELAAIGTIDRDFYLKTPAELSGRVQDAADRIRKKGATAEERIVLLQEFFREQKLAYATSDLPDDRAPIDQFLFEKKRGYCEFFASSFALMLRLSGVPARLVGGYFGGSYNALGNYYVVTEDTAHVWVEALVGTRWRHIDPSRLALNAGSDFLARRKSGLNVGRKLLDAANYFWTQAVINYDLQQQLQLFNRANLQLRKVKAEELWRGSVPYLTGALAVVGIFLFWRRQRISAEERIIRRFLRRMQKVYGIDGLPPGTGLHELARRIDDPLCREFVALYGRAVYRDRILTSGERRRLHELIDHLGKGEK